MAISRWTAHAALASSLAVGALAMPAPARAQSYDLSRAIADIASVMVGGNRPYYGRDDRIVVVGRDDYGPDRAHRVKCNKEGKCKAEYYDPRYDQRGYDRDDDDDDDRYERDDDRDDDDGDRYRRDHDEDDD